MCVCIPNTNTSTLANIKSRFTRLVRLSVWHSHTHTPAPHGGAGVIFALLSSLAHVCKLRTGTSVRARMCMRGVCAQFPALASSSLQLIHFGFAVSRAFRRKQKPTATDSQTARARATLQPPFRHVRHRQHTASVRAQRHATVRLRSGCRRLTRAAQVIIQ